MNKAKEKQEKIIDELIAGLEKGCIPWQNPCFYDEPRNMLTKRQYHGINHLYLSYLAMERGYEQNIWGTFNQIRSAKGCVAKGEHAVPIVYYTFIEKDVKNKSGEIEEKKVPFLRYYNVFNVSGQTNIKLPPKEKIDFDPIEKAEKIVKMNDPKMGVSVDRNYYSPSEDKIYMNKPENFRSKFEYYGTLFHEMGHWTGHESRLKRPLDGIKDDPESYSFEELVAEITSSFMMNRLCLRRDKENTQAYINNWVKFLKEQKTALVKASSKASKAVEYLTDDSKKRL
jgi:antirestriction protein ArdC